LIRETVEGIRKHFADDAAATAVITCMSKGLTGSDICYVTGMTQRQMVTTVERIRRFARRGDDHNV
jgi:hypothetical protein